MYTEEYILLEEEDLKKLKIQKLADKELELLNKYIEFTRHINEIKCNFDIYKYNYDEILHHYIISDSDRFVRHSICKDQSDFIALNSLLINYISSSRIFTESIERFFITNFKDNEAKELKEKCLSIIYDKYFSYRFFCYLRNYCQHGHMPVFVSNDKRISFNLDYILDTQHFKPKKLMNKELETIATEIKNKYGDNPKISVTFTVSEHRYAIFKIYITFINSIINQLANLNKEVKELITRKPKIVNKSNNYFNEKILFSLPDGSVHCLDMNKYPVEDLIKIKKDLNREISKIKRDYTNLNKLQIRDNNSN